MLRLKKIFYASAALFLFTISLYLLVFLRHAWLTTNSVVHLVDSVSAAQDSSGRR